MNKIEVVVLGRNYISLLGMIRALGVCGYEVTVIETVRNGKRRNLKILLKNLVKGLSIADKSKYVKKYFYATEPNRDELVNLLISEFSNRKEKVVLIPTDDFVASTIDLYQEKLKKSFLFPNIKKQPGEAIKLMDKDYQKRLAIDVGLTVAKGWTICIKNGKYEIPNGIEYPCFTKPEISFMGNKSYMKKCNNLFDLIEVVDDVAKVSDCPILVEEYIEFENEYGVLGCSDGTRSSMPTLVHKIEIGKGAHRGVTLLGQLKSLDNNLELKEKLVKLIEKTEFTGLFDIDLYEKDGIFYFNELNLRFGAFGYALMCAGVNLPNELIKILIKQDYNLNKTINKSIICLNDKVNIQDFEAGHIVWQDYRDVIKKADYRFIVGNDDPMPFVVFKINECMIRFKRSVKKIVKRIFK